VRRGATSRQIGRNNKMTTTSLDSWYRRRYC